MDLEAFQKWRNELEHMTHERRMRAVASIKPVEIAGTHAPLLASPVYVTTDTHTAFRDAAQELIDAAVAIESHATFLPGNILYDHLYESLSVHGKKLIDASKKPSTVQIRQRFRRLDGFITTDGRPMFIEMNQSAPLAISFYERARELIENFQREAPSRSSDLYSDLARWFVGELTNRVEGRAAVVAVSMERGYPAKFIDLPVACAGITQAALALGWQLEFVLAEPTEFTYTEAEGARVQGRQFDLLWRNTVYLQNYPQQLPQYEVIRYGDVPMVNDLQAWLFRSKGFFAMIWDDTLIGDFTSVGVDAKRLRRIVPESYFVTTHVPADKDEWILKRCDDGFGQGIVFGADVDMQEWQTYLEGAHGRDWILQRLVQPLTVQLPVVRDDGKIIDFEGICDFDPYVVGGKVSGVLVRALPHARITTKMNIVEGAAIGYVAVAD